MGLPEIAIVLMLMLGMIGGLAVPIIALVDAAQRDQDQFTAIGSNRMTWIVLLAISIAMTPLGVIMGLVYWLGPRRRLAATRAPAAPAPPAA